MRSRKRFKCATHATYCVDEGSNALVLGGCKATARNGCGDGPRHEETFPVVAMPLFIDRIVRSYVEEQNI